MVDLAVLVPVLGRPQNVAPLVANFGGSLGEHPDYPDTGILYFLVNGQDREELEAIFRCRGYDEIDYRVVPDTVTTWPQKVNWGVQNIDADWYLCAADDITFTEGWWEATAELRSDPKIGVIGTADSATGSGNQAVAEGSHTCHPLVRASYIREQGTWDWLGRVVSEDYHHWYVDNELVVTAKMRRAWAFCPEAVLEHNHPYWKPDVVPWDATYALGEAHAEEDKQTWFRRAAQYGPLQTRD